MTTIIAYLKKLPWWFYVGLVVFVFFVWQNLSGFALSRKLYTMALDNLRVDQTNIIKVKEDQEKMYEKEIVRLVEEIAKLQKEKAVVQKQAVDSAVEVARLKGRIGELETQYNNIVISDDPDKLIDDLRRLGIRSIRRAP